MQYCGVPIRMTARETAAQVFPTSRQREPRQAGRPLAAVADPYAPERSFGAAELRAD
jgi:hypothetical protein